MILGGVLWLLVLGNVTPNIIQHMIENKEMNRDSYSPLISKRFQCWSKIYFTDDRFFGGNFAIFGSLANFGSSNALG